MEKLKLPEIIGIKEAIGEGKIPYALELLRNLLTEEGITDQNEYFALKSKWSKLRRDRNEGLITDPSANVEYNKLVKAFLSYLDQLNTRHGADLVLSAVATKNLPVLDESVRATLEFFLACYQRAKKTEVSDFDLEEVRLWFDFSADLEEVAHIYTEHLTDVLNNENSDAFLGVRPMLRQKLRNVLGKDKLDTLEPKKLLDQAILSTIIKEPEPEITVNQVLEEYIPRLCASITPYFDLKVHIYNHLQRFNEGNVGDFIAFHDKNDADQAIFSSQINASIGQVHQETITIIAERFSCNDDLRESLYGVVRQYVEVVNQEGQRHYLKAENLRLKEENRKLLAEREPSAINQSDMYKFVILSLIITGLSIFVYHWIWARDSEVERIELIEQRIDSLQVQHDSLVRDLLQFDQQNTDILDGLLDLK